MPVRTGDFDVAVRLASLGLSDVWAKAGLMARETMDPGARFAAALAAAGMNGDVFRVARSGAQPAAVRREFSGQLSEYLAAVEAGRQRVQRLRQLRRPDLDAARQRHHLPCPAKLRRPGRQQPPDVTSRPPHNSATSAMSPERGGGRITNPHEPLGPSSRKSPLSFRKSCTNPPRARDGNNTRVSGTLQFQSLVPGHQRLPNCLRDNMNYTFPADTSFPAAAFFVVAASPPDMQSVYGYHQCLGTLHRQPEEIRHAPIAGRAGRGAADGALFQCLSLAGGGRWHRPFHRAG